MGEPIGGVFELSGVAIVIAALTAFLLAQRG